MGNSSSSSSSSSEEEEEFEVPAQSAATQQTTVQTAQPIDTGSSVVNPYRKHPRLTAWASLLASSLVALTSVLKYLGGYFGAAAWILLVTVITVIVCTASLVFYAFFERKHYVGKVWGEGVSSYVLLILWLGALPVCMSPSRRLAVSSSSLGLNFVSNANLYFSSWACFICIFFICASWTMTYWTKAAEVVSAVTGRLAKWWCLFVASVVLLVSASQFHVSQDCGGESSNPETTQIGVNACRSNRYAVALGAWSCLLTLLCIVLSHIGKIRFIVETFFAVILFAFFTAGVALITYREGSGTTVGNLFFSTWIGFILTLLLCIDCYLEHMKKRAARKAAKRVPSKKKKSKRKPKKEESKKKKAAATPAPQPVPQPTNLEQPYKLSMRSSSIGEDEFADARDDLELQM